MWLSAVSIFTPPLSSTAWTKSLNQYEVTGDSVKIEIYQLKFLPYLFPNSLEASLVNRIFETIEQIWHVSNKPNIKII